MLPEELEEDELVLLVVAVDVDDELDDEVEDELDAEVDEDVEPVVPAVPVFDVELVDALPLVPPELVVLARPELWAPVVEPGPLVVAAREVPVEEVEIVPDAPHPAAKMNSATASQTRPMVEPPERPESNVSSSLADYPAALRVHGFEAGKPRMRATDISASLSATASCRQSLRSRFNANRAASFVFWWSVRMW